MKALKDMQDRLYRHWPFYAGGLLLLFGWSQTQVIQNTIRVAQALREPITPEQMHLNQLHMMQGLFTCIAGVVLLCFGGLRLAWMPSSTKPMPASTLPPPQPMPTGGDDRIRKA
jgi:hypothetical protein